MKKSLIRLTENDLYNMVKSVLTEIYTNQNIPKFLYHKSPYSIREKILQQGLIPKVGASYQAHWENELSLTPYIFLYDHNTIKNGEYDSTWDDDIWQIDTSKLDLSHLFNDPDELMIGCLVYDQPIPPSAIKLVYQGSNKDSWDIKTSHSHIYNA